MLKDEEEDQAHLNANEEAHISEVLRLNYYQEEEETHLNKEEDARIAELLRLKANAGGFCDTVVER